MCFRVDKNGLVHNELPANVLYFAWGFVMNTEHMSSVSKSLHIWCPQSKYNPVMPEHWTPKPGALQKCSFRGTRKAHDQSFSQALTAEATTPHFPSG